MFVYDRNMAAVNQVEEEVLGRLLRGEIPPGTRLQQDEIAEEMQVSKIPVREGLQRLTALGLLRFEPNRGVFVPDLTAEEAEENFALRSGIEPLLLSRSAPKLSIVDLAEAELALTTKRSLPEANWTFHHSLYQASGWTRGLAIVKILHAAMAPYVLLYAEHLDDSNTSAKQHFEILDLCRRGDVDEAISNLETHLNQAERTLLEFLKTRSETNG